MKIETRLHVAAEMKGKLAQEMMNYSFFWDKLFNGHMDDEGLQVIEQSWQEWINFIAGFDIGYQTALKGEDLDKREIDMTMRFMDSIIKTLEKEGHYQRGGV